VQLPPTILTSAAGRFDFAIEKEVLEILEVAKFRLGNFQDTAQRSIANAISILTSEIHRASGSNWCKRGDDTLPFRQVQRICEYIDQHIDAPIGVAELARVVSRSSAHFSRKFKRTLGLPPHTYVSQRRIALASKLLVKTDLPMVEIALQCGFADQAHFSRRFRELTGLKPTSWRRAMGDKEKAVALGQLQPTL
jgi:AraC-like DNA-binding protein